MLMQLS